MTPTPAATIVVVRDSDAGPEVLLVKRHGRSSFMADHFVFPGGKVDAADNDDIELAAVREVFEESGILLVQGEVPADRERWRNRLAAGELGFNEMLSELKLNPDYDALHYWGCWTTPSMEKRRFVAHFYVAVTPPQQEPSLDDKEITDILWSTPAKALQRHKSGEFPMPPPQLHTLTALDAMQADTVATLTAMLHQQPRSRVAIMPRLVADS
ncbi:MAG: NUDIX hydrolase, partial [Alphaproteobacteria bacterium]